MATRIRRTVPADPFAAAVVLGPEIASQARLTDSTGRISDELWTKIRDAGLLRMWLPKEVGGAETDLPTITAVCEELARHVWRAKLDFNLAPFLLSLRANAMT